MKIEKGAGRAVVKAPTEEELARINTFAIEPLTAEQVFTFRVHACDDQVDRDLERFTPETLEQLAGLFIGKPMLFDHSWSALGQTARVYDAGVVEDGGARRLRLSLYMLANADTAGIRQAILGGILREVSVGVAIASATCCICGQSYQDCGHRKGRKYDGKLCHVELSGAVDAYELSFVAVPAQREAGVVKCASAHLLPDDDSPPDTDPTGAERLARARARLALRTRIIHI